MQTWVHSESDYKNTPAGMAIAMGMPGLFTGNKKTSLIPLSEVFFITYEFFLKVFYGYQQGFGVQMELSFEIHPILRIGTIQGGNT